jgi:hypothetical protein
MQCDLSGSYWGSWCRGHMAHQRLRRATSAAAKLRMRLYRHPIFMGQSFARKHTVRPPSEVGQVELNLIPAVVEPHGHGANEGLHSCCRLQNIKAVLLLLPPIHCLPWASMMPVLYPLLSLTISVPPRPQKRGSQCKHQSTLTIAVIVGACHKSSGAPRCMKWHST